MKYSLFVGSSVEGLKYARAVQQNLKYEVDVTVWAQGIFRPSNYPLEDLLSAVADHDFGAFIFLPEDILILRGERESVVRDNVLFELGLFFGRLGRQRAFLLKPMGAEMHLPSDLAGLTPADFQLNDSKPQAGIGAACTDILTEMQKIGSRSAPEAAPAVTSAKYDREAALLQAVAGAKYKPLLRGRQYMRTDAIKPTGDVAIVEHFINVVAFSDQPVGEVPVVFQSRSGRPANWRCESQTPRQDVRWEWRDLKPNHTERAFVFDPPLGKAQPISFRTERHVFNGFSFTRAERLELTSGKETEESARFSMLGVYDMVSYQITFPETRFPPRFRITAWERNPAADAGGSESTPERYRPNDRESGFAGECLTPWAETRSITLTLPKPLPGATYEINWELPDEVAPQFTGAQLGFTEEMSRRLLGLRVVPARLDAVSEALQGARERVVDAMGGEKDGALAVSLYIYDRQKAGLVCVATVNADRMEANWQNYLFKPGRHIVGIAFRNRAINPYTRPTSAAELDPYELAPGETEAEKPYAAICIPLFYIGRRERSLAVLCVSSATVAGPLVTLCSKPEEVTRLETVFANWYEEVLAGAVGVIPSARFWGGA